MKLTVFGASGGIGTELVRQALAAGHEVTAVVRRAGTLDAAAQPGLREVVADVMDPEAVAPTVKGQDAVVSALGPRAGGPTTVNGDGSASIITALQATGVRRLLVISMAAIHTKGDDPFTRFVVKPLLGYFLRYGAADSRRMESQVRASGLDWTIVAPPQLLDKPAKGKVRSRRERTVPGGFRITRADVAAYLLTAIDDPAEVRATTFIAN
ncbi:NAD(P)-dependent oxidoreductase [Kribbella sp. DT2]|uniref:NAD(P)-dependent oxidoreductase n=1 Tax=Kribbella sp. DT2 TaxID=3393427 RepID=UPI003CF9B7D4